MNNHVCPHCRTEVPSGATVCTGCQAEVEYGPPKEAFMALLVIAAMLGGWLGSATNSVVGWIVFAAVLVAGSVACFKVCANRVSFKRMYKTR